MKKILVFLVFLVFAFQLHSQVPQDSVKLQKEKSSTWVGSVIGWYSDNLNYATITMLMAIESSFIPFPSEVVVPPAAYSACNPDNASLYVTDNKLINIALVVLFATVGALIGAFINYFLAYFLGRPVIYWFAESRVGHLMLLDSNKIKKAENYFVLHGNSSTFIGRLVPGIRQLISIPAGLAKMKITPFVLYTLLGSCLWNIILAVLGYVAHGQQELINKYSDELSWVLLALGVVFVSYLLYKGLQKKSNKESRKPETSVQE
jgi:membrane protein DedA with SNARE-associated domain